MRDIILRGDKVRFLHQGRWYRGKVQQVVYLLDYIGNGEHLLGFIIRPTTVVGFLDVGFKTFRRDSLVELR